jgi:hypothetical protein
MQLNTSSCRKFVHQILTVTIIISLQIFVDINLFKQIADIIMNLFTFSDMRKIFPFGLFHLGGDEVYTG